MQNYQKTALAAAVCTALGAGQAGAATFQVTNADDSGAGSLRQRVAQAGGNAEADVVDLSSISGQTVALTSGQLYIGNDDVTINGADVTIDGGGNSRVLLAQDSNVTLNDLTITGGDTGATAPAVRGFADPSVGGGIASAYSDLTINNSVITANTSAGEGGGIFFIDQGSYALTLNDSVISANESGDYGGGLFALAAYGDVSITGADVSNNAAYGAGGGLLVSSKYGQVAVRDSVVTGNVTRGSGAARNAEGWAAVSRDLERGVSGGPGPYSRAGGAALSAKYSGVVVENTTISSNQAGRAGGLEAYSYNGNVDITGSTISGNTANNFGGGALLYTDGGTLRVSNTTISGNSSGGLNGGLVLYGYAGLDRGTPVGSARVEFTTITNNTASDIGGLGISMSGATEINASVVAGNGGSPDADIGFNPASNTTADVNVSLVGFDSTTGTLNLDADSTSLLGQAPELAPLADNGGPTFTHLPAASSPLLDAVSPGTVGCDTTVTTDQRGEPRPSNAGCEIGSVERGTIAPPPEVMPVPVIDRFGTWLLAGLLGLAGLFGFRGRSGS